MTTEPPSPTNSNDGEAQLPAAPGRVSSLNGHDFGPYHYAGMGNTERECLTCHFRQDEQLEDERVPPCTSGRTQSSTTTEDSMADYTITVEAFELTQEQAEAMYDRVADAAHALDEQVTVGMGPHVEP